MLKIYSKALSKAEVNQLIKKYPLDKIIQPDTEPWGSQYDERSASINYALVRDFKPQVVVEFGSRAGRCARDITRALMDNGGYFVMKPYEKNPGLNKAANNNLEKEFGSGHPLVGGDILDAYNIPDGIEYLFVDNCHDDTTTEWVFSTLIKKCRPGCLIHFHDLYIEDDWHITSPHGESQVIGEHKDILSKVYWTWEEGNGRSSAWFQYKQ